MPCTDRAVRRRLLRVAAAVSVVVVPAVGAGCGGDDRPAPSSVPTVASEPTVASVPTVPTTASTSASGAVLPAPPVLRGASGAVAMRWAGGCWRGSPDAPEVCADLTPAPCPDPDSTLAVAPGERLQLDPRTPVAPAAVVARTDGGDFLPLADLDPGTLPSPAPPGRVEVRLTVPGYGESGWVACLVPAPG